MKAAGFGDELFLGRLRTDLLALTGGDPRRLTTAEEDFLARLREFCDTRVDGPRIEREDRIPDEVINGLRDIGALCIRIPREYGGLGLSGVCYYRALMIVTSVHSALGELLAAHQSIGLPQPLLLFGTERQKRVLLPRCAHEISAFALTEAEIGNDPEPMSTTAVPDPESGHYRLNGVKLWTTNGVVADLLVVMAVVPPSERNAGGMSVFVVEADSPGVTVEHRSSFLGLRGLENGVIRLRDVIVPTEHRIGEEGSGLAVALGAQDTGRLSLPAVCAAAAKWSLKIAREWAGTRVQWGRPIGEQEAVAGKLAFISGTAFALEAMVEVTGRHAETDHVETGLDAELAKLFASEKGWLVADELVQLRGGRGYETADSAAARGERGVPAEQRLRDLRVGRIFDGSSEALRTFISSAVLDRRGSAPTTGDSGGRRAAPAVEDGPLRAHLNFADEAAHRLFQLVEDITARIDTSAEPHQRDLGRIVDIAAELYAMSASCAYAAALDTGDDTPIQLADAFCAQATHRITGLFEELADNTDSHDRLIARRVLDSHYTWLEDGVPDPSTEGPWISEPVPGMDEPDLRRTVRHGGHTDSTPGEGVPHA
ncbi:hypothetical protein SAMN04487905_103388 [Actinopolyspora xinjiangensis]|uniref:Acyl-CoA dehydrogenase n=1 Tax=Actinopolyspora xinjiangensis TaxID=405564 RepID=A0A1H0S541_9ACTN|nr:acyl-CoA dehydrogenase family protein [Actinopolyspora xinjiangensis]SDP36931.1 hypothetical protein SAMN04487905_103388 [Actinopolyspora xinjiangensis]